MESLGRKWCTRQSSLNPITGTSLGGKRPVGSTPTPMLHNLEQMTSELNQAGITFDRMVQPKTRFTGVVRVEFQFPLPTAPLQGSP